MFDDRSFSKDSFDERSWFFGDEAPGTSPIPWGRGPTRKQVANHLRRREDDALFMTGTI
jgi:hypothetical protein